MELLQRAMPFELESVNGDGLTMTGYAAVFNSPTLIDSWEGTFMEQIAPGAFRKTLRERTPALMYEHGQHPFFGPYPIGNITNATETERGLFIEARLHDNWLVSPIRDAIASGAVDGMSFRFSVVKNKERWDRSQEPPLRTLLEVRVAELGPVLFPAYADTTVAVRSALSHLHLDDATRATLARELHEDADALAEPLSEPEAPLTGVWLGTDTTNTTGTTVPLLGGALTLVDDHQLSVVTIDDSGTSEEAAPGRTSEEAATETETTTDEPPTGGTRDHSFEAAKLRLLRLRSVTNAH